jgi:hypothetical protein
LVGEEGDDVEDELWWKMGEGIDQGSLDGDGGTSVRGYFGCRVARGSCG